MIILSIFLSFVIDVFIIFPIKSINCYFLTMKQAKQDIIQIPFKEFLYMVSIVEKQNDSGIMYNDRVFFLQPGKCIGYISEVKIDEPPSKINFDKPKLTIPVSQLKTFVLNERELHIKVIQTDGSRRLQKDWNLRMSTPLLAKKWYDKLQREKIIETVKKSSPKIQKNISGEIKAKVEQSKVSPPRKSMQITRNESFTYNVKPDIEKVQAAVGVTPVQSESSFKRSVKQTRQFGTIMSQKAESKASLHQKESSNKRQPSKKQLSLVLPSEPNKQIQKPSIINKIQCDPQNEGVTDRSFAQPIANKSVHSQPVNRTIESFKFNRKNENQPIKVNNDSNNNNEVPQPVEKRQEKSSLKLEQSGRSEMIILENQIRSKDNMNISNIKSKDRSEVHSKKLAGKLSDIEQNKSNQPQRHQKQEQKLKSSGIRSIKSLKKEEVQKKSREHSLVQPVKPAQQATGLNNKKYITPQEFQKLNTSTPISYLDRTSQLIKASSHSHSEQQPEPSIRNKSSVPEILSNEGMTKSPSDKRLQEKPPTPRDTSNLKFSILQVKQEQQCNESEQLHQIIQGQYSSIAVQQQEKPQQKELLPWTYKYLQFGDTVFNQFLYFSQELMQELIEDFKLPTQQQVYKNKQIRNSIVCYHIHDVQAKIAIINIEDVPSETDAKFKEKVCSRRGVKALKNEFSNFHLLYQHLQPTGKLKVPLVCLCEMNGFVGLFKILSKSLQKQIRMRDIEGEIEQLKGKTKINNNLYHNHNRNIIQIDHQYYKSLAKDTKYHFNCYFIQQIQDYLLPDFLTDRQNKHNLNLLRKELISQFADEPALRQTPTKTKPISKLLERTVKDAQKVSKNMLKVISETIVQIDSLSVYFFSSRQVGQYLHKKGINVRYLGHIYEHLTTPFQRRVLMSEIAARSCKSLFRKTLQDIIIQEDGISLQTIILKSCDFLNCLTSNSFETAAIWKVLSSHSVEYFGVQLDFDCIEKGYFLISLIENCRLDVVWEKIHPHDVFKDSMLFTEKNILALSPLLQTYHPFHNFQFALCSKILQQPHSQEGLQQLLGLLRSDSPKAWMHELEGKAKHYMSLFVSPYRQKEENLGTHLYEDSQKVKPCRGYFDLLLMEIKWYLKYKDRQNYIKKCDQFIKVATKYFGEFHPIFSQLYDLFSSYHLSNLEFEDSITFAKSSLVNILKVCGTNHDKTSQCYYNLALCYIKAGKKEEAFAHMKKAKLIFENSGRSSSVPYAIISLKLALIYLNQDQPEQCLNAAVTSLEILQRESLSCYQDQLVDCFQMITRCYEIMQEKGKIQEIADKCEAQLSLISSPHNLERALKIITYPILSQVSPENASVFLDVISQLSLEPDPSFYTLSVESLKVRIREGTLLRNLCDYLSSMQEVEAFMRESNFLESWQSFKESYPRETVSDFMALTEELLVFLGEGFMSGSLREAL